MACAELRREQRQRPCEQRRRAGIAAASGGRAQDTRALLDEAIEAFEAELALQERKGATGFADRARASMVSLRRDA